MVILVFIDNYDHTTRPHDRVKRDSGLGDSSTGRRDFRHPDPRFDPHVDPRIDSIQNFWLESRRFHPVLSDKAFQLLKEAFNLASVPP
jgi:hypothetical protein